MRVATFEVSALFGNKLDELTYRERLNGPAWLSSEMVATEPAREKLRTWIEATPPPWQDVGDVGDIRERIRFNGDGLALALTASVVAALPPPNREYALRTISFIGVLECAGFCSRTPDLDGRPWFITVSSGAVAVDSSAEEIAARFKGFVAHEIGHAWLDPEPIGDETWMSAQTQGQLTHPPVSNAELAAANPEAARRLHGWKIRQRQREDPVERLCRAWGFDPLLTTNGG